MSLRSTTLRMTALLLAAVTLSACTPAPTPSPTPTAAFTSEEEAFAAAEEVYRAYNDAGNARRDGASTPDPQDYLIGVALEGDIDALNQLRNANVRLEGDVSVSSFTHLEVSLTSEPQQILSVVCLDMKNTRVLDRAGNDVTPKERNPTVSQRVTFIEVDGVLLIAVEESTEDERC